MQEVSAEEAVLASDASPQMGILTMRQLLRAEDDRLAGDVVEGERQAVDQVRRVGELKRRLAG